MSHAGCFQAFGRDFYIEPASAQYANAVFQDEYQIRELRKHDIRTIVDLQVNRLAILLERRGYGLAVTDAARAEVANRGYDPANGARPLKRVIQQELQNRLATELLRGNIPEESTIRIDFDGDDFTFQAVDGGNGAARRGDKSRGDEILSSQVV